MQIVTKDNVAGLVFEEGFKTSVETALEKGSDVKLKVEFDWSETDVARALIPATKDLLSDFNNKRRAAMNDQTLKDGTVKAGVSWQDAAAAYAIHDEARNTYVIRVKDLWTRVRTAGPQKSVTAQAATMSPEKLAETIAALQKMLAEKQS